MVELSFTTMGSKYIIRRGIKPKVFEIIKDGKPLNQEAMSRDQQEMLETSIIKMNQKSFSQIVVLGLANFIPFMQLPTPARRAVIEDLLDIQIFSTMNSILKERVSLNKTDVTKNENRIQLVEAKIDMYKIYLRDIAENNEAEIQSKKIKIANHNKVIDLSKQIIISESRGLRKLEGELRGRDKLVNKLNKLRMLKPQLADKVIGMRKDITFYERSENCPTCK